MKTVSETLKEYEERRAKSDQCKPNCCVICNGLVRKEIEGCNRTADGEVCNGCYYEQVGQSIEKSPITSPKII